MLNMWSSQSAAARNRFLSSGHLRKPKLHDIFTGPPKRRASTKETAWDCGCGFTIGNTSVPPFGGSRNCWSGAESKRNSALMNTTRSPATPAAGKKLAARAPSARLPSSLVRDSSPASCQEPHSPATHDPIVAGPVAHTPAVLTRNFRQVPPERNSGGRTRKTASILPSPNRIRWIPPRAVTTYKVITLTRRTVRPPAATATEDPNCARTGSVPTRHKLT